MHDNKIRLDLDVYKSVEKYCNETIHSLCEELLHSTSTFEQRQIHVFIWKRSIKCQALHNLSKSDITFVFFWSLVNIVYVDALLKFRISTICDKSLAYCNHTHRNIYGQTIANWRKIYGEFSCKMKGNLIYCGTISVISVCVKLCLHV